MSMSRLIFMMGLVVVFIWGGSTLFSAKTTAIQINTVSVVQGFQVGNMMRFEMKKYHNDFGRLPASNSDLGLPEKETYADQNLMSAGVGEDGVITLAYTKKSGVEGGVVQIVPSMDEQSHYVSWGCRSSSYPSIQKFLPQCRYIPPVKTEM